MKFFAPVVLALAAGAAAQTSTGVIKSITSVVGTSTHTTGAAGAATTGPAASLSSQSSSLQSSLASKSSSIQSSLSSKSSSKNAAPTAAVNVGALFGAGAAVVAAAL